MRLQAALVANSEDVQAAKSYLADAKAHLAKIGQQMQGRQNQSDTQTDSLDLVREDSGQSDLEQLMGREEMLDHRPGRSPLILSSASKLLEPIVAACSFRISKNKHFNNMHFAHL